jgi:hypothetical protein
MGRIWHLAALNRRGLEQSANPETDVAYHARIAAERDQLLDQLLVQAGIRLGRVVSSTRIVQEEFLESRGC